MKTAEKNRTVHSVLRQLVYGLYIMGVCDDPERPDEANAFVASWVSQCSFEPPLIMAAVKRDTLSHEYLEKGRAFSLNLLDKSQEEIARLMVKPHHRVGDKLGKVDHYQEVTGAPILRDAQAFLECKVTSLQAHGDHSIAIGEVVNAGLNRKGEPLTCGDLGWHYAG